MDDYPIADLYPFPDAYFGIYQAILTEGCMGADLAAAQ
jgi:hypothetical protein